VRVIAGKYRSRPLQSLRGIELRPTADRLRETLFDVLTAGNPDALHESVWLDLYAGTGAVGIEALSRGASVVLFIESDPHAADLIRKNLAALKITAGFQVLQQDSIRALRSLESSETRSDFVFLDPPYSAEKAYSSTLSALAQSPLLKPETVVIAEHQKRFDPGEEVSSLHRTRKLVQGDAALSFYARR
jgi:16S rRNA (guanine966-N2)-methyltransferase